MSSSPFTFSRASCTAAYTNRSQLCASSWVLMLLVFGRQGKNPENRSVGWTMSSELVEVFTTKVVNNRTKSSSMILIVQIAIFLHQPDQVL